MLTGALVWISTGKGGRWDIGNADGKDVAVAWSLGNATDRRSTSMNGTGRDRRPQGTDAAHREMLLTPNNWREISWAPGLDLHVHEVLLTP